MKPKIKGKNQEESLEEYLNYMGHIKNTADKCMKDMMRHSHKN